jgi:23S rRNA (uracil1939-C5)-methyltransferase
MRAGDSVEVTVEKAVYRGLGLARHEGRVVFVPRGRPGDRLRVRIESVEKGFARATAEALLEEAGTRRGSPCPLFAQCGGCAYQHVDYVAQLGLKEAILRESLSRSGVAWEGPLPVRASPEEAWRTRATFHLQEVAGSWRLGLHAEGTHRVVDLDRCLQLSPAMNRTQRALAAALGDHPQWARRVAHVEMAESLDGSQLAVALESDLEAGAAPELTALADAVPWLTGLGVMAGRRYVHLRGSPWTDSTVQGVRLRAHVRSFFQANRFLVGDLVEAVLGLLPPGGTLLDLYAGVGLFSLSAAARAEVVRAAEANPFAVEDARYNASRARQGNVQVRDGDVVQALRSWPAEPGERVVLDPPRTGAGPEVLRTLAARRPSVIVYVSCDPPTLGRDLKTLGQVGYRVDSLQALDMFPDTHHLEAVARVVPA